MDLTTSVKTQQEAGRIQLINLPVLGHEIAIGTTDPERKEMMLLAKQSIHSETEEAIPSGH